MCSVLNLITATLRRIFGVVKRYARTCKVMSCTYVGRFQNFKFGSWERGKGGSKIDALRPKARHLKITSVKTWDVL